MDHRNFPIVGAGLMGALYWLIAKNRAADDKQWGELLDEFKRQDEKEATCEAYRAVRSNLLANAKELELRAKKLRQLADDLSLGKDQRCPPQNSE